MKKIILFIFLFFINIITNANYNKIYSYNKTYSYDKIEDIKIDEVTEYNSNSNIIGSLFKEFLYGQEKLVNKPFINFNFGLCENLLPNKLGITTSQLINSSKLTETNSLNFEYGFVRLDTNKKFNSLTSFSSEFAYIELNTNKYYLFDNKYDIYDNEFSFGIGMRTGMSRNLLCKEVYFLHSGAFLWTYFDYAGYQNNNFFRAFDENYKFGFRSAATIEARLNNVLFVGISCEHNNVYSSFKFGKWFCSWLIDNILQRWIDLYEPKIVQEVGTIYPLLKFVYKNTVSIVLSNVRKNKQYYPFNSEYSLLQRKFNINCKLVF